MRWPGSKYVYYGHAVFMVLLGILLLAAPSSWFGPSWSYFPWLPHNGIGMGACCIGLGGLQLISVYRDCVHLTATLIYLGGVVNWTAGILIAAEGIFGHQGLMEAPWMCAVGGIKFIQSSVLLDDYRRMNGKTK